MTNPHLRALLEKHRAQLETGKYFGYKRDYFQRNLKQILELVAAGVQQEEILVAFEQDGMRMSKRYFSNLLNEVRQYGHLSAPLRQQVPQVEG
ncbi:hypothetical protein [Pseudomonas sp. GWSMS-1]|uniref:hypothetical protein n=1 Tax=Pseudomonas sp. GWSMS-1 TaxID=3308997 RepID=UPI003CF215D9